MFIVRLPNRDRRLHLALAVERETKAVHPEIKRTKRIIGREMGVTMREVEGTGEFRKDCLDLKLNRQTTETERGRTPYQYELRVPLSGVSDHVRRLPQKAADGLAQNAREIAEAQAEVKRLRDERAELVRQAWRRSRKSVDPAELEEIAERTASIAKVPGRALAITPEEDAQLKREKDLLNAFARKALGG